MKENFRKIYMVSVLLLFLIVNPCYGLDYTLSTDFDLIENSTALHNIRIYGLTSEITKICIFSKHPFKEQPDIETTMSEGSYRDFNLPAGSKITVDQPVIVIKYDANNYTWDTVPAGKGTDFSLAGSEFFLIAASEESTNVSIDLDNDGSDENTNLNAGYALIGWMGEGKTIISNKPVLIFTFTTGGAEFKNAYLLTPGSSAYAPLNPIIPDMPKDDFGDSGIPEASLIEPALDNIFLKMANWVKSLMIRILTPTEAQAAPGFQNTINNGDGTFTFEQKVDEGSTSPHYVNPGCGFGCCKFGGTYGWRHTFPDFNRPNLQILSVKLIIRAWDVDAEPWHGYDGEYDGIMGDGSWLNPQYLQGTNNSWSVTNFNVDPGALYDGGLHVAINIDMHHPQWAWWCTDLDFSLLRIHYTFTGNNPPYSPILSISPTGCTWDSDNLVVSVTGPNPSDPDGDSVIYNYRWLVDIGTGNYIDDEFAGRSNHINNIVPASDTRNGDKWKVEVTPVDSYGASGTKNSVSFATIGQCNTPPIADAGVDRTVGLNASFTLNGSGSNDSDGTIAGYKWELYSGGWITIGTSMDIIYSFTSPGTYTVRLTVTDNQGATDDDLTYITVRANQAPIADAGTDQTVSAATGCQAAVTLNGTGSSDPDGDPLTFSWSWSGGNASGPIPQIVLGLGTYTITLTVNDERGGTDTDTVVIIVNDITPPEVKARDITVELDASGQVSISAADVDNGSSDACGLASLTVSPDSFGYTDAGPNIVSLTVTDNNGNTSSTIAIVNVILTLTGSNLIIKPEALQMNPGEFTAFVVFPPPLDALAITDVSADGAPWIKINYDSLEHKAIIKFNRRDITELPVDTHFNVIGYFNYRGVSCKFIGSDDIRKVLKNELPPTEPGGPSKKANGKK